MWDSNKHLVFVMPAKRGKRKAFDDPAADCIASPGKWGRKDSDTITVSGPKLKSLERRNHSTASSLQTPSPFGPAFDESGMRSEEPTTRTVPPTTQVTPSTLQQYGVSAIEMATGKLKSFILLFEIIKDTLDK